ncbi:unnamed protein product [Didymodactylos carnosus]|uniref:Uncharacterized protein n=1 Tax=Didymodactylos carnosus TaxID=1234261 RepID=A0A813VYQ2_9BILA|nr:unnamed protein product [Didymodactylos carnosus]CAF0850108.1 unnamed protein product [Didymodactylos carnosus]CAF3602406.1 unnamed protein product [Didymodactylos carnosus]CAF3637746.1 unnamed protein product [Didymodactylos carnosus]
MLFFANFHVTMSTNEQRQKVSENPQYSNDRTNEGQVSEKDLGKLCKPESCGKDAVGGATDTSSEKKPGERSRTETGDDPQQTQHNSQGSHLPPCPN